MRPRVRLPARVAGRADSDLQAEAGTILALVGRSGHGKSILLRALCGTVPEGAVQLDGSLEVEGRTAPLTDPRAVEVLAAPARGAWLRYAAQGGRENFVPGWNVERHVRAWAAVAGALWAPFERRFRLALDALGLVADAAFYSRTALALSEGMNRRVALALVFAGERGVAVLDEPTTGLDPEARRRFTALASQWLSAPGRGMVVATHDAAVVRDLGARVVRVEDGGVMGPWDDLQGDPDLRRFAAASDRLEAAWTP